MNSRRFSPHASDEIPVVNDCVRRLVEGLDSDMSLDSLFPVVVEMAKDLELQEISCKSIVKMFEDEEKDKYIQLRTLFHTLDRDFLRSLLLGTLPFDLWDEDSENWAKTYHTPSLEAAGTYLIAMSIDGREGRFLSGHEIGDLVRLLETYELGCKAWLANDDSYNFSQLDDKQKSELREALKIDNELYDEDDEWDSEDEYCAPFFVDGKKPRAGSKKTDNIRAFREQLEARLNGDLDIIQCSSPTYVGCSQTMSRRMVNHVSGSDSSLANSSALRRLLASCIRHMGLQPVWHAIPAMLAWEPALVPLSEVLVTVLAQSLVTRNGLNVIQPGMSSKQGTSDTARYEMIKKLVWIRRPWFINNVEKSLEGPQGRDIYQLVLDQFPSEEDIAEELRESLDLAQEVKEAYDEVEQVIEEQEAELAEDKKRLEEAQAFYELSKGMFPELSDDVEEDGGEE